LYYFAPYTKKKIALAATSDHDVRLNFAQHEQKLPKLVTADEGENDLRIK
jgi:hypothetical protein